jgi:hypothetical protein
MPPLSQKLKISGDPIINQKKHTIMTKKQILKIIVSVLIAALTTLRLRLRTIRDKVTHGIFRLALRFPKKLKFFGGPMVIAITIIVIAAIGLNSCNVVRTISNKSEYYQRGDTAVMIQTKTTESYDAKKNITGFGY